MNAQLRQALAALGALHFETGGALLMQIGALEVALHHELQRRLETGMDIEKRFAGHPTILHIAQVLVASREPGPELNRALYVLEELVCIVDQTRKKPGA